MARTGQLNVGETLEQFAARMGITLRELYGMNPGITADAIVEGMSLVLPEPATATQEPATPAPSAAPTGELTTETGGLFQEMMKEWQTAFQTFLSSPAFIQNLQTAQAATKPTPGFSRQEASFLRDLEPELQSRYYEKVQRQFAETGEIPTLTAGEFLKGIKVREEMEMAEPYRRGVRYGGVPSVAPRRLKF